MITNYISSLIGLEKERKNKKMKYKRCEQKRHDCFGCDSRGCCVVLNDTTFKRINGRTYKCPFYKTIAQAGTNAEEIKAGDFREEQD